MKKTRCIFCNEEKERAKEHIWPRWLQIQLTGDTKSNFRGTHLSITNPTLFNQRNQYGESLVFGNICKDCNGGWMNELEIDFKSCFTKIQKNYNLLKTLDKKDRLVISLWGLKTAMMINSGSNYRKIIPQNHYEHLYKYKQVPKDVKVEVGYINNDNILNWEQSTIGVSVTNGINIKNIDPYELTNNSYVVSMQIEHLAIKIIYFRDCKKRNCEILSDKDSKSLRIWPYKKNEFNIKKSHNELCGFHFSALLVKT